MMNFFKVVDHSIRQKFLRPDYSGLSFLGSSLAQRLEREWYANTYIQNTNAYLLEQCQSEPTNVQVFQQFLNAKLFSGCGEKSISLVSRFSAPPHTSPREIDSVSTLMKCLPTTNLTLYTLISPSQKMDEFSRLQRKRRLWWKSLLHHPEHLLLNNVPSPEKLDPFIEQRIEYTSKTVDNEPLEVMSLYTSQIFENCEVSERNACQPQPKTYCHLFLGWWWSQTGFDSEASAQKCLSVACSFTNATWTGSFVFAFWKFRYSQQKVSIPFSLKNFLC